MKICAASDNIQIKTDDKQFYLYVNGTLVDTKTDYNTLARLATDLHVSIVSSNDDKIGRTMFAPSATGTDGPVIIVAKIDKGYLVQKLDTGQRFEILPEFLSEMPASYFQ